MNNCLVTKLKAVVDNNNLPILGAFDIVIPCNGSYYELEDIWCSKSIDFKTIGGYFSNSNQDNLGSFYSGNRIGTRSSSGRTHITGEGNVTLRVADDYSLKAIKLSKTRMIIHVDLEFLYYRTNLNSMILYGSGGAVKSKGDLSKIKPINILEYCSMTENVSGDIIGDFADIPLAYRAYFIVNTSVNGTLESFLENNINKILSDDFGETKVITFNTGLPKNATFNGNNYTSDSVIVTLTDSTDSVYTFNVVSNNITTTAVYNSLTDTWTYS